MPSKAQQPADREGAEVVARSTPRTPAAAQKSSYKASTYAASGLWLEESKVKYAANPKRGKSFVRYAAYEKAATIGEALRLGALPADLLFDYEKGHLAVSGPARDKPLDLFTMEAFEELSYTDKVLCRYLSYAQSGGDQEGGKIKVLEESIRKQRANMKRLGKLELARQLEIKDLDLISDSVGFWETPVMMGRRSMAAAQAREILAVADEGGRKITDYEVLQVLRLWDFRENETRRNVMREGQTFVYSDSIGLVADRTGHIVAKEETRRYPIVAQLLNRWLREHVDREHLGVDFVYTTININKNYAGRLHRDGNNVGPSFLKAFGEFTGGDLNYFPEDDRGLKLEELSAVFEKSQKLDVAKGLLLFDGKRAHCVDDFGGERYSLVYFTCPRYEKATEETMQVLRTAEFPIPTQATMASVTGLLRKPRGYADVEAKLGRDAKKAGGGAPSAHDAPFILYPLRGPGREAAEAEAEAFWKQRGLKKVNTDEQTTLQRTEWEHCKANRGAKWMVTAFVQLPAEPARKDLILEGFKNMVDAAAFLNAEEAKAPKAVAKEGCCALFSARTRVWYGMYARGQRKQALEAFGEGAAAAETPAACGAAQSTPPAKRAAPPAGRPPPAESAEKRRRAWADLGSC